MADATDLNSVIRMDVGVRLPSPLLKKRRVECKV